MTRINGSPNALRSRHGKRLWDVLEPVIIAVANRIFIIINFVVMWMTFTSKDSTFSYLPTSTSRSVVNYVKAFNGRISLLMINWVVITACQLPPTGHYCCCHKSPCTLEAWSFQLIKYIMYQIHCDTRGNTASKLSSLLPYIL